MLRDTITHTIMTSEVYLDIPFYPSIAYSTYVQNKDCLEDKKRYHLDSIENELDLKKS